MSTKLVTDTPNEPTQATVKKTRSSECFTPPEIDAELLLPNSENEPVYFK